MDEVKVIVLVGMPGAGKGICTTYLTEKYAYPVIHFGKMVYEEIQRRGLDNVKDEIFVREDMREKEGVDVLAKHAAKKAMDYINQGHKNIVLDGLYSWSEYKYLEKIFGKNMIVIALAAPKKLRRQRVLERKDSHRKYTLEQITKRELSEIEDIEKGGPIAYADYTILNDSSPKKLFESLDQTLKKANVL